MPRPPFLPVVVAVVVALALAVVGCDDPEIVPTPLAQDLSEPWQTDPIAIEAPSVVAA